MSEPDEELPPTHQAYGRASGQPVAPSQGLSGYSSEPGRVDPDSTRPMFQQPPSYAASTGQPAYGQPAAPYGSGPPPAYGQPYGQQPYQPGPGGYGGSGWGTAYAMPATDSMATTSMIMGIISLVGGLLCGVGLLLGPVAIVLGILSRRRISASATPVSNRGHGTAGLVLGIISTVLLILAVVGIVLLFALLPSSSDPTYHGGTSA